MGSPELQAVFLLSLPRSGSTLVQRILTAHEGVATTPEPWLVLPHLYALREDGVSAVYEHHLLARALSGFVDHLPDGIATYREALRDFVLRLYGQAAPAGTRYFVDKTPRYHLVLDDLLALFPDAPVIVLWRNPLAVVASMVATWDNDAWFPARHETDLFLGVERLVDAVCRHPQRIISVNYEQLLTSEEAWVRLFSGLGIPFDRRVLEELDGTRVRGHFGDPSQHRYDALSTEPLEKWRTVLDSPVRVRWCRSYLRWIGADRLAVMGYDLDELERALATVPTQFSRAWRDLRAAAGHRLYLRRRRAETQIDTRVPRPLALRLF